MRGTPSSRPILKIFCPRPIQISFLQNFANGGHCEFPVMSLCLFSSFLALRKKSNLIFAKFREWWPLRIRRHVTLGCYEINIRIAQLSELKTDSDFISCYETDSIFDFSNINKTRAVTLRNTNTYSYFLKYKKYEYIFLSLFRFHEYEKTERY